MTQTENKYKLLPKQVKKIPKRRDVIKALYLLVDYSDFDTINLEDKKNTIITKNDMKEFLTRLDARFARENSCHMDPPFVTKEKFLEKEEYVYEMLLDILPPNQYMLFKKLKTYFQIGKDELLKTEIDLLSTLARLADKGKVIRAMYTDRQPVTGKVHLRTFRLATPEEEAAVLRRKKYEEEQQQNEIRSNLLK